MAERKRNDRMLEHWVKILSHFLRGRAVQSALTQERKDLSPGKVYYFMI